MKTKSYLFAFFATLFMGSIFAQDKTTVTATSNDISDNLDLRAVASIFGESKNLEDFERRLNDPETQISNLDLNGDRRVDYLRVIESVESNSHIIIVQAVLEKDIFQDVATIEVEKGPDNAVQIQVVGDVYMYGDNYIYEPVYVTRPIIYDTFWVGYYRPYYSSWYWGYYPSYYYAWAPCPIYRYRRHIHTHINVHNHYYYATARRSDRYYSLPGRYRSNGYAASNPSRSFRERNANVRNSYELQQVRNNQVRSNPRSATAGNIRNNTTGVRNYQGTGTRNNTSATVETPRTVGTRNEGSVRSQTSGTRSNTGTRSISNSTEGSIRNNSATVETPRSYTPRNESQSAAPRNNGSVRSESASPRTESPRVETPRSSRSESPRMSAPQSSQRNSGNSGSSGSSRGENRGGGRR